MKLNEMPLRTLHLTGAGTALGIAALIGYVALRFKFHGWPLVACLSGIALTLMMSLLNLRWACRTPSGEMTEVPYLPNIDLPADPVRRYGTAILFVIPFFSALSAWIVYQLHQLESGAAERVMLGVPGLDLVYHEFGYWPTVLAVPSLGVLCVIEGVYNFLKARAQLPDPNQAARAAQPWTRTEHRKH